MKDIFDPVQILKRLIQFDTSNPPGNEGPCIEYISTLLRKVDVEPKIFSKEYARPNLYARLPGRGEVPPLLLYGHVDVVTVSDQVWQHDPFGGEEIDGFIWGRGAVDMKGGVAMMLSSFMKNAEEKKLPPGDIIFLALSDEEVGGELGAKYMLENHSELFEGIRFAIGEFGGFNMKMGNETYYPIQVAEKQGCGLEITIKGPAGHGSQVHQGGTLAQLGKLLTDLDRNLLPIHITPAASLMVEAIAKHSSLPQKFLLHALLKLPLKDGLLKALGDNGKLFEPLIRNTVNVTLLKGGAAVNVLPSEIKLNADVRILPGYSPEDTVREIRQIAGNDFEVEVVYYSPYPKVEVDMGLFPVLGNALKGVDETGIPIPFFMAGVTDARFFARLGIQTYGFTPMKFPKNVNFLEIAHAPDERIPAEAVVSGSKAIFEVLKNFGNIVK